MEHHGLPLVGTDTDGIFNTPRMAVAGDDVNKADEKGVYPAMSSPQAFYVFQDVIQRLSSSANSPVNIGYLLYHSYHAAAE